MSLPRTPPRGQSQSNPDLTESEERRSHVCTRKRKQLEQRDSDFETRLLEYGKGGLQDFLQSTVKQVISTEMSQIVESLKHITATVTMIADDNDSIKQSLKDVTNRLAEIDKSLNYTEERQNEFNCRLKSLEDRHALLTQQDAQIQTLNTAIASLEQQARQCNMEISNLPEKKLENLLIYIERLSSEINYPLPTSNIVSIHRVPHADRQNTRPKNIIVKFATKYMRDNFIAAFRAKRGVDSSKLGISGHPHTIYCNEHLTLANKILFRQCRETARKEDYKFVWVKHGNILMRKSETSPVIAIRSLQDLSKIK